jgi:hypothetical protein
MAGVQSDNLGQDEFIFGEDRLLVCGLRLPFVFHLETFNLLALLTESEIVHMFQRRILFDERTI